MIQTLILMTASFMIGVATPTIYKKIKRLKNKKNKGERI